MTIGATQTFNGAIPMNGPQVIKTAVEINSTFDDVIIDLKLQQIQGIMVGVQTLFINLNDYDSDVIITMPDTQQRIVAKAKTQGYYPILSTNLMKFNIRGFTEGIFDIFYLNFPVALGVWGLDPLKGDKGEQGPAGENGIDGQTILIENSNIIGNSIAVIAPDVVTLKKLIAGDNITIDDTPEGLTINGAGGGTGGGGTAPITGSFYLRNPIENIAQNVYSEIGFNRGRFDDTVFNLDEVLGDVDFLKTGVYAIQVDVSFYNDAAQNPTPPTELDILVDVQDGIIFGGRVNVLNYLNTNRAIFNFNFNFSELDEDPIYNRVKIFIKTASQINEVYVNLLITRLSERP